MKKKAVAAVRGFVLCIGIALLFLVTANANAQLPDRAFSLVDIAHQLKTPDSIARYLWRNFLFETDQHQFGRTEYRQSAEEFLSNGKGDCEDFANMAYHLLRLNGYNAFLMNIYGDRFAHTICIFEENGKYRAIDGSDLRRLKAESLNDLASGIYPYWKEARIGVPSKKPKGENGVFFHFAKSLQAQNALKTFA